WQLGSHSYLSHLRDRLLLAQQLLAPDGSVFVQISEDNVHHVRELLDDIFRPENAVRQISFLRGGAQTTNIGLPSVTDFLLWYAKDHDRVKMRPLLVDDGGWAARSDDLWAETASGTRYRISDVSAVPAGGRAFTHRSLESARDTGSTLNRFQIEFDGKLFI